jgi:hypothetical protein
MPYQRMFRYRGEVKVYVGRIFGSPLAELTDLADTLMMRAVVPQIR